MITWIVNVSAGILYSVAANLIGFASSSSKLSSKFNKSLKFVVSNAKAKCFASVGFSESLFSHLDFPFNSVQFVISLTLTTPILLHIFPLIKDVLGSLRSFEL